ncbi:4Fe-4S dicluster domain-containing protein [Caldinitratiruptor microaerophilus]|uniref:4Fe-4S ferredoxin n=1 Tax=Caldinitratiruptor microaerophilus TaxID=671077 RepID=A0AA35CJZ4_9FIRM|nr:4Fe-4S dicluster domain-containing protein [Caldinitratiruptor microaerophilus]BDG60517.1 4Fe-4S ferredoxin [Caldinitratiruptor microaerophilus]
MSRYAMFVDLERCVGCSACTVACQASYGLAPENRFTKVNLTTAGEYPSLKGTFVTTQCMHCEAPPCAEVCPTGATYKTAEGPVVVREEDCIGCRYCVTACPYDARTYDEERKIVRKCSFCYADLQKGREPACVRTCIGGARLFGDLDDPESAIARAIREADVIRVAGTSFYYRLPEGMERDLLPADFEAPRYLYPWQSVIQPLGQIVLAGAASAAALSLAVHGLRALRERRKQHEGA